jgi:Holliday junction resolvasome RuvABC endonuclease subunit
VIAIGLDLSLCSTGCVAVPSSFAADTDWTTVRHRLVTSAALPNGASVRERTGRLLAIAATITKWIQAGPVDVIAIEEQAFRQGLAHSREIGELSGIVKAELLALDLPIVMVTASAARKTLLGTVPRSGAKDAVAATLRKMGAPWTDTDRSDAFAVANHVIGEHGAPCVMAGRVAA